MVVVVAAVVAVVVASLDLGGTASIAPSVVELERLASQ